MAVRVPIVSTFSDSGFRQADKALDRLAKQGGAAGAWAKATQVSNKAVPVLNKALAATAVAGGLAVKAASDQEQAFGALDAVYGSASAAMQAWAREQEKYGLSAAEAGNAAVLLGSQLGDLGFDLNASAEQSQLLTKRAADMAAMYGGTTADAVSALSGAFRGEYNSLERYAANLKQADVNARAMADTGKTSAAALTSQEKAAATLALVMEKTARAHEQADREIDTVAATTAAAKASYANASAEIAGALMPAVAGLAGSFATVAQWAGRNPPVIYALVGAMVAMRVAIAVNNAVMGIYLQRAAMAAAADKAQAAAKSGATAATTAGTTSLWGHITAAAASTAGWVRDTASTVGNTAARAANTAATTVSRVVTAAWTATTNAAAAAGRAAAAASSNAAKAALGLAGSVVKSTASWVANTAATVASRAIQLAASTATKAAAAAQWLLNAALTANPIGLIIALIAGLVAGLVLAYKKSTTFRNAVDAVGRVIRNVAVGAFNTLRGAVESVVNVLQRVWDKIQAVKSALSSGLGKLGSVMGFSAAPTIAPAGGPRGFAPAPSVFPAGGGVRPFTAAGGVGVGVGAGLSITVNGASNPQTTAREIAAILTGAQVRTGYAGVKAA